MISLDKFGPDAASKMRADIKKKQQALHEELVTLETMVPVAEMLPAWLNEYGCYLHKIESRVFGLNYVLNVKPNNYSSLGDTKSVSMDHVEELAEMFPAVPMVFIDDGCKALRKAAFVETMDGKQHIKTQFQVCPVHIRWNNIAAKTGGPMQLEWSGRHKSGDGPVLDIHIKLPHEATSVIGYQELTNVHRDHHGHITSCYLFPYIITPLQTIENNGQKYTVNFLKYGSGDNNFSGDRVAYWVSPEHGPGFSPVEFVRLVRSLIK